MSDHGFRFVEVTVQGPLLNIDPREANLIYFEYCKYQLRKKCSAYI